MEQLLNQWADYTTRAVYPILIPSPDALGRLDVHFASGWATLQRSAGSRLDFQVSLATEPSPLQFS